MAVKDRTGEKCPFCDKGKLFVTGKREVLEPAITPKSGEYHREFTEYECDACHKRTGAHGLGIGVSLHLTGSAKVEKKSD